MSPTKTHALFSLALFLLTLPLTAQVAPDDLTGPAWASWRGPQGNSITADQVSPAALKAPKVLWTQTVGAGYSAVHPVGKVAFTTGRVTGVETLFCLSLADGKKLWQYPIDGNSGDFPGTRASPVYADGKVYCMNRDGLAYCVKASDGTLVWKADLAKLTEAEKPQWGFASSPVLWGNLVLWNVGHHGAALNAADGKVVWKSGPGVSGYASFVLFPFQSQTLAAVFTLDTLHVVDPKTGQDLASARWKTMYEVNAADPLVVGNQILVSSDYGRGAALFDFDGKALKKVWENTVLKSHFSSMVSFDGAVYANDGDANASTGAFVCLSLATGKELWRQDAGVGSLIAVGRHLLTLSERGRLALVEVNSKAYVEVAAAAKVGTGPYWPAPTIAGGKLFLRNNNGVVTCLEVSR